MGARWRLCISLWRLFECVKVRVTLNQENGWAHLPKPCFQLDGPAISKIKLLRLVFAYFSLYTQKHRTFVRCFCCVFFVNTFCPVLIKKMQHPRVFQRSSQAAKPQKAGSDQSRGECACKRTGGGSAALCREGGAKQTLLQRGRSVIKGSVQIQ